MRSLIAGNWKMHGTAPLEVGGALVGRASLKAVDFEGIFRAAGAAQPR